MSLFASGGDKYLCGGFFKDFVDGDIGCEFSDFESSLVFTHLHDAVEGVRGQRDSVPVRGDRPTTGWAAGEVIVDPYEMPVNADAPPGAYRIEIGMYDPATGDRPTMTREDGAPIHERRILFEEAIVVEG